MFLVVVKKSIFFSLDHRRGVEVVSSTSVSFAGWEVRYDRAWDQLPVIKKGGLPDGSGEDSAQALQKVQHHIEGIAAALTSASLYTLSHFCRRLCCLK